MSHGRDHRATAFSLAIDDRIERIRWRLVRFSARFVHGTKVRRCRRMGVTLALNTDRYIDTLIYLRGTYEPEVLRVIDPILASWGNGLFVDVGANIGAICTHVAARHPRIEVIAFEPQADLAEEIRAQQAINGVRFAVEVAALSDSVGTLRLHAPAAAARALSLGKEDPGLTTAHPGSHHEERSMTVPSTTLDEHLGARPARDLERPMMVKIDVEGHEMEAIEGMRSTLSAPFPRLLVVELLAESRPGESQGAWDALWGMGYRGEFIGRRRRHPVDLPHFDGMYLFARPGSGS
jgi:FkbM family methyltransferase